MKKHLIIYCLFVFLGWLGAQNLDLRLAGAEARTYGPAAQPVLAQYGDKHGLLFTATFLTDSPSRVVWDLPVREDLTHCAGVRLRFFCQQPRIVRQYKIYLRTNDCWQSAVFTPRDSSMWQEIYLPKASFKIETKPSSWQQVSMVRLTLLKGATGRTALHLASLEFVRPNCPVALLRSGTTRESCRLSYYYADVLSRTLESAGILPAVIEESDTSYLGLRPYRFLFLPLPGAMPSGQQSHVLSFLRRGGKAAVFHNLPPLLQQQMRLPAGRFVQASALGLDLCGIQVDTTALPGAKHFSQRAESFMATGHLKPPLAVVAYWQQSNGAVTPYPAIIESPSGYWMTQVYQGQDVLDGGDTFVSMLAAHIPNLRAIAAAQCYERARRAYNDSPLTAVEKQNSKGMLASARTLYEQQQFGASVEMTRNALSGLRGAEPKTLPPRNDELRGVWADLSTPLPGSTWNQTVKVLMEGNLNAVFTPVASPVVANFNSKITPLINNGAILKDSIKTCRRNGIQVHGWLNCLSLEQAVKSAPQKAVVDQWRREQRLQVNEEGQTVNWLCPSQIVNRQHIIRLAAEMATEFEFDGIQLDCVRYPSQHSCFCPACHKAFLLYLGRDTNWPADVQAGGTDREQWLRFREQILSSLVAEISAAVRQARPTALVSASVFPNLSLARQNMGQDWNNWLDYNYLSFVCPMNYVRETGAFQDILNKQIEDTLLPHRILPVIGLTVQGLSLRSTQEQVQVTRQLRAGGFVLHGLGLRESQDVVPYVIQH